MYDIIIKKKLGAELLKEEIEYFVSNYTLDLIPDYQVAALLMAIYFQGMTARETADLTNAMANSGDTINLSDIPGIIVDKHSTGGVGDKTTLIVAPIVAACGIPVAKMSGRGLGHTGGTIDKLEAIAGFNAELTVEEFIKQVNECKLAIVSQSGNLTPADKKIYALRDVTGTVDSLPLIASSIMSKKIASGANAIVLDVKVGNGAFMKTIEDAEELAVAMVNIGKSLGRATVAIISDMEQPLGNHIGNANEVLEAIKTLEGNGPTDLLELSVTIAVQMLLISQVVNSEAIAREMIEDVIRTGRAARLFKDFLHRQGVSKDILDNLEQHLCQYKCTIPIVAKQTGYINKVLAEDIGRAAMKLGAGRITKGSIIDSYVGIKIIKKIGDYVVKGDVIGEVYGNDVAKSEQVIELVERAIIVNDNKVLPRAIIHKIIS
jgi:pyrimidine-nucleoside phosphorylase